MQTYNFSAADFQTMQKDMFKFLFDFTAIPSVSSDEKEACEYIYQEFFKLPGVVVERQYLDNSIMDDPYWNPGPYFANDYTGHFNVIATWKGTGEQAPVYVNAHIDTVMSCSPDLMPPHAEDDDRI